MKWQHLFSLSRSQPVLYTLLVIVLAASLIFKPGPVAAANTKLGTPIGQMQIDDDNLPISFPSLVFFDPFMKELYVINNKRSRIVVYGPDLFPRMSIGESRSVRSPTGLFVSSNGDVYISQSHTRLNPRASITVLNGAFFVKKEIFLDQIPETVTLSPTQLAVKPDGTIYLTGENHRAVVVLDNKGNFLRTIQIEDEVSASLLLREAEKKKKQLEQNGRLPEKTEEKSREEEIYANIPEEYRPRSIDQDSMFLPGDIIAPIRINYVTLDKNGNLYLLSAETGKIYVYDADENFLFSFGNKGGSPGQMSFPRSLAIDEKRGFIYAVDFMRHSILAYNMTGEYLFEFGGRGAALGWFNYPFGITINHLNQLFISDYFNKRIQLIELKDEDVSIFVTQSAQQLYQQNTPESEESTSEGQILPGQPESLGIKESAPESFIEQPSDVIEEEIIEEKR